MAISLIAVLLAALGGFTLNAVTATNELRARQAATHIATSAMASDRRRAGHRPGDRP